jgi:hypothetical protein
MTIPDVLDGSIAVIKAAPRVVFGIAAAFIVPVELVGAWIQRDSLADNDVLSTISDATSSSQVRFDFDASSVALIVLQGLVLALVAGAIAHVLTSWYADHHTTAANAIRASVRRAPALVVAWLFVHVAEALALVALVFPAVCLMPLFLVVSPAIVVESLGPWKAVRRSWRLTRGRYGTALWTAVLIGAVATLLTAALTGLGVVFSFLEFGWVLDATLRAASALVTIPFVAAATTLAYLDMRIRSEGLDLELDIAEHFPGPGPR